jgi:hydrogenase nickel incorporation protein HypB
MCVVCGCGTGHSHEQHPNNKSATDSNVRVDATGDLHYGAGEAQVSVPGLSQTRTIRIEQDVLGENDRHAARNRENFIAHGVLALNLVSSPGSGKTTLLCATLLALRERRAGLPIAVIEGDQQTRNDAERIRATGVPAIQINTGKGCHLDARMITEAYARLPLHDALHAAGHKHHHPKAPLLSNHHPHHAAHDHHAQGAGEPAVILFI